MASLFGKVASAGALGVLAVACAVGTGGGTECVPEDAPDSEGKDSNCDGIDGVEKDAIFVAPDGNDSNAGTKQQPLKTVRAGLAMASQKKKTQVLVAGGRYTEADTLNMPDKVGLYGGYDPKTWARSSAETRVDVAKPLAMDARGLTSVVTLGRITIAAADNTTPGGESIGLRVVGVPSFVISDGATIIAGRGGAGTPGAAGMSGAGGNPGKTGGGGNVDSQSAPGNGGVPGDNATCPEAAGGSGGGGGRDPNFAGVKGSDSPLSIQGGPGGSTSSCTPVAGQDGKSGADGEPGGVGTGGLGAGKLDTMTYAILPQSGTDGTDGKTGPGGGGGGGSSGQTSTFCVDGAGNGGGGGGAGGCGGKAGKAGSGGGASIAILAITSPVALDGAVLVTGGGGAGGAGGAGGDGGPGAIGGDGGSVGVNEIGKGGKGGDGRKGGAGGAGGGGGGGASVGVWSEGGSTPKALHVTYRLGEGGAGGACMGAMTCGGAAGVKKELGP